MANRNCKARGDRVWAFDKAVAQAGTVIMAVPDRIFGTVAARAVPLMDPRRNRWSAWTRPGRTQG